MPSKNTAAAHQAPAPIYKGGWPTPGWFLFHISGSAGMSVTVSHPELPDSFQTSIAAYADGHRKWYLI